MASRTMAAGRMAREAQGESTVWMCRSAARLIMLLYPRPRSPSS